MLSTFRSSLIFLVLLAHVGVVLSSCSFTTTNGNLYNLTALNSTYNISANDYKYSVRICSALPFTCYGMRQSVCRVSLWGGVEYACGSPASMILKDNGNDVSIVYDGGEGCGGTPRTSTINILCDIHEEANLVSVAEVTGCDLVFNLRSRHGCPITSNGTSNGTSTSTGTSTGFDGDLNLSHISFLFVLIAAVIVVFLAGAAVFYLASRFGSLSSRRSRTSYTYVRLPFQYPSQRGPEIPLVSLVDNTPAHLSGVPQGYMQPVPSPATTD